MCLLGASRWHSWHPSIEQRLSRLEPARLASPDEAAARIVVQLWMNCRVASTACGKPLRRPVRGSPVAPVWWHWFEA